ncbi:MAG: ABC transporter substrate-binding protein [Oligosphaeraceae bacterium]
MTTSMFSTRRHHSPAAAARLLLLLAVVLLGGCAPHAQPPQPTAERIISLAPSLTETLFALGLGDRLVADTQYCVTPEAAKALPKVGAWNDVSAEQLLALRPTAVCLADTHPQRDRLAAAGLPLVPVRGQTLADALAAVLTLGQAFGRQPDAERLHARLLDSQRDLRQSQAGLPRLRLLVVISRTRGEGRLRDLIVAGDDGYFRELAELLHCDLVPAGTGAAYPAVSAEGILALDPDAIVEIAPEWEPRGEPGREQLAQEWRQALPTLKAAQPGRILVFTENDATVPGLRTIAFARRLADQLRPLRTTKP